MNPENKEKLISILERMCFLTGIDTVEEYEGIKNDEDIILYLNEISKMLPSKRLIDDYQVKRTSGLY
jgi:hypothetical protein